MTLYEFLERIDEIMCGTSNAERAYLENLYYEVTKPHWISAEEELPPKKSEYDDLSNNVLATDGKEIYESVYNHDFEDWFTHDMWGLDNITHWMPMPEAPTVAENATVKEKEDLLKSRGFEWGFKKGGEE